MLTQDERQRIEAEEQKRIAEEQYRAEVRTKLEAPPAKKKSNSLLLVLVVVLILIASLLFIGSIVQYTRDHQSGAAQSPYIGQKYVPVSQKIATGEYIVKAGGYLQYRITITPDMVMPTLKGSFTAEGGQGNDIQGVLTDEPNFINWINGHQARSFWGTVGRETTGNFDVRLAPGNYVLAFSNKFSILTDKNLSLDADLSYSKLQ